MFDKEETADNILKEFGLTGDFVHIINGHVPVERIAGENPVKCNGKLILIDGGFSKTYRRKTGIAGYTLIYDSHSLSLAEHKSFIPGEAEHTPTVKIVEQMRRRVNVADTDIGKNLLERIDDLRMLLNAYRRGDIKEQ